METPNRDQSTHGSLGYIIVLALFVILGLFWLVDKNMPEKPSQVQHLRPLDSRVFTDSINAWYGDLTKDTISILPVKVYGNNVILAVYVNMKYFKRMTKSSQDEIIKAGIDTALVSLYTEIFGQRDSLYEERMNALASSAQGISLFRSDGLFLVASADLYSLEGSLDFHGFYDDMKRLQEKYNLIGKITRIS
jgi:hypothetical protein